MRTEKNLPRHVGALPTLVTLGNAVCGFAALRLIMKFDPLQAESYVHLEFAAYLIFIGMLFDVFDGRVARMTGTTSQLGAQLDSLADLVTFGLAPAMLTIALHRTADQPEAWSRVVWLFGLAYFLGAILRLARFNAEHSQDDEEHVCFKGMPTPAAAGCLAGLVIVRFWLDRWDAWELRAWSDTAPVWIDTVEIWIAKTLPFLAFLSGYAMVSNRLFYPHVASVMIDRRQPFETIVYLVFGLTLAVFVHELVLGFGFLIYMLWTPVRSLLPLPPPDWLPKGDVDGASLGADDAKTG